MRYLSLIIIIHAFLLLGCAPTDSALLNSAAEGKMKAAVVAIVSDLNEQKLNGRSQDLKSAVERGYKDCPSCFVIEVKSKSVNLSINPSLRDWTNSPPKEVVAYWPVKLKIGLRKSAYLCSIGDEKILWAESPPQWSAQEDYHISQEAYRINMQRLDDNLTQAGWVKLPNGEWRSPGTHHPVTNK